MAERLLGPLARIPSQQHATGVGGRWDKGPCTPWPVALIANNEQAVVGRACLEQLATEAGAIRRMIRHIDGWSCTDGSRGTYDVTSNLRARKATGDPLYSDGGGVDRGIVCASLAKGGGYHAAPRHFGGRTTTTSPGGALTHTRPAVLWVTPRKVHNRRMHALHGNTSQAEPSSSQASYFHRLLDETIAEDTARQAAVAQALEVEYAQAVPPPTERPRLIIDHPPFMGPPHLSDNEPFVCPVPPDGRCLYYCALALQDARAWLGTHDDHGRARDADRAEEDTRQAETMRMLVREKALMQGHQATYERLGKESAEGYPGLDEVDLVAAVLGGSLVVQIGEVQVLKGDGPLVGHLHSYVLKDAAGHGCMHWEVFQSWYVSEGARANPEDGRQDTLPAAELEEALQAGLDPILQRRLEIPGAATSRADFDAIFAELSDVMARDETMQPDEPREESTLVGHAQRIEQFIERAYPEWPPDLKHLALVALHVYKCRLADVYMREYVMLTHVILGRGRILLRTHERTAYIWNDVHGVWHRYEGLLPEDVYTFLKNTLLMLEGLLRTFSGDVPRNDADVLAAIDRSFRRHGSDWGTASVAYSDTASLSFGLRTEPGRRRQRSGPVPRQPLVDDGDETHADPSEPWYVFVAKGISRIGRSLEHHLLGT